MCVYNIKILLNNKTPITQLFPLSNVTMINVKNVFYSLNSFKK